jgi:hypothetical protein
MIDALLSFRHLSVEAQNPGRRAYILICSLLLLGGSSPSKKIRRRKLRHIFVHFVHVIYMTHAPSARLEANQSCADDMAFNADA